MDLGFHLLNTNLFPAFPWKKGNRPSKTSFALVNSDSKLSQHYILEVHFVDRFMSRV